MINWWKPDFDSYFLSDEFTLNLSWELDSLYILLFLTSFKCGKDLRIYVVQSSVLPARKQKHTGQPRLQDHRAWTRAAVSQNSGILPHQPVWLPWSDLFIFWSPSPFLISSMTFLFSLSILGLSHPNPCLWISRLWWGVGREVSCLLFVCFVFRCDTFSWPMKKVSGHKQIPGTAWKGNLLSFSICLHNACFEDSTD